MNEYLKNLNECHNELRKFFQILIPINTAIITVMIALIGFLIPDGESLTITQWRLFSIGFTLILIVIPIGIYQIIPGYTYNEKISNHFIRKTNEKIAKKWILAKVLSFTDFIAFVILITGCTLFF
ncbi:MAG: hypothetical protein JXA54_10180 [Candidatus Heimdallarchaeota archaeon]|nr:hypothetical protein [Candidatus Heimdallarchaeota archaeon]